MSKANKKQSQIEEDFPILKIPIIEKLNLFKGLTAIRKLMKFSQSYCFEESYTLQNSNNQTFLLLLQQGSLERHERSRRNQGEQIRQKKSELSHILIDLNTEKIVFSDNSAFHILRQKYIFQLFEGIISFPFIETRLQTLKKNQIFQKIERKNLIKIAFDLEEIKLKIGTKISCNQLMSEKESIRRATEQCENLSQLQNYCYYIINGQIEVNQGKDKHLCVLAEKQVFSNFGKIQDYCGKVVSERATLYKIKEQLIPKYIRETEYEDKRIKWRLNRMANISTVMCKQLQKKNKVVKAKESFIEKEKTFTNISGYSKEELNHLKTLYKNDNLIYCETREEFYGKKLDKIRELQRKRYGKMNDTVVLFEFPLSRALRKVSEGFRSRLKIEDNSDKRLNLSEKKMPRRVRTTETISLKNTTSFLTTCSRH